MTEKVMHHWATADKIKTPGLYFLYRTDDEELQCNDNLYLIEVVMTDEGFKVRWASGSTVLQFITTVDEECRFLGPVARKVF